MDCQVALVIVEHVEYGGGTLALARGRSASGAERITFAGEPRALHAIAEAIAYGEEPLAHVPDWAILRREPMPGWHE